MPATRRAVDGILADTIATGKTFDPAAVYVGLFISGPTTNPPVTVADFVLPDPTDMPAQSIGAWAPVQYLLDGRSARAGTTRMFRLPSATNAFVAQGWYIADALTGGNVLEWGTFNPAVSMPDQHSVLTMTPRLAAGPSFAWDATVSFNG